MKQFTKIYILFFLCILLLLNTACSKTSVIPNITEATTSVPNNNIFPDYTSTDNVSIQTTLSSGVLVDAKIHISDDVNLNSLSTYYASLAIFDFDKAKEVLLGNKRIINEILDKTGESKTNSPYRYCDTSDGFALTSVGENLYFTGDAERKITLLFDQSEEGNSDQFSSTADLDFASRDNVQKEIESVIQRLNISVEPCPTCYVLDYETLAKECEKYNEYMNNTFDGMFPTIQVEKDDECYIFIYQLAPFDLPISTHQNGMFGDGSWTSGTYVQCTYSSAGLIGMQVNYQFTEIVADTKDNVGMTVTQALDCLNSKYNSMILEGRYLVYNIEFEYVPVPDFGSENRYALQPAWRFSIIHFFDIADKTTPDNQITVNQRTSAVFNAITGKELAIDYG